MANIIFNGTVGDDTLVVTATSADSGDFILDGGSAVFVTAATSFTFNGLGGNDIFTIIDPQGGLFAPTGGIVFNDSGLAGDSFSDLGGAADSGTYTASGTPNTGTLTHVITEVQQVAVSGSSGTFTLSFNGQTTANLAFNATAVQVQSALNALATIGGVGGSVIVTAGVGVYTITFGGTLADANEPQITGTGTGGASVVTSTLHDGGTQTVQLNGVATVTDTVPAATLTIDGTAGADTITVADGTPVGSLATTQVSSPTFESLSFADKTAVVIDGQGGGDTLALDNPDPATGLASLTITNLGAGSAINGSNPSPTVPDIVVASLDLQADGIGVGRGLRTQVGTLAATAGLSGAGNINIANGVSAPVTLSIAGLQATNAAGGTITLSNDGTIDITVATVTATANIDLTAIGATADIDTGGGAGITSNTGSVVVTAGEDINLGNSGGIGSIAAAGGIVLQAGRDITVNGNATVTNNPAGNISVTAGGNITMLTSPGSLANAPEFLNQASGGEILLTAGSGGTLTLDSTGTDAVVSNNGIITLNADAIGINKAVTAGAARVVVAPATSGVAIDLGGQNGSGVLGLTQQALSQIIAGVVQIGNSGAGNMQITAPIFTSGTNVLSLVNNGTIAEVAAGTLTIPNLRVSSTGPVGLNEANNVGALAASTTGPFVFNNGTHFLTIGIVDGVAGITTSAGNISLTADGFSIAQTIDAGSNHIVTLDEFTAGASIGLGTAAGMVQLSGADLNRVTAGGLIIGDLNAGTVTIGGTVNPVSATGLGINGSVIDLNAGALVKVGAGILAFNAGSNVTVGTGDTLSASGVLNVNFDQFGSGATEDLLGTTITASHINLTGGAGSDIIFALPGGNQTLNGGGGSNTAVFDGNRGNYTLTLNGDGSHTITDNRPGGPDGTDTLLNIQFAQFADQTIRVPQPATLVGSVVAGTATEGMPLVATGTFTDSSTSDTAADFTAAIDWGDGTTQTDLPVTGGNGAFTVTSTHFYADEGGFPLSMTLTRSDNLQATAAATAADGEADTLTVTGTNFTAIAGHAFTGAVASVIDPNTFNTAGDFVVTINWGDGTTTAGTLSGANGAFTVSGAHTYAASGQDDVAVTVADDAPGTATGMATTVIAIDPTAPMITALVGQPVNGSTIRLQGTGESGDTVTLFADGGSTPVGTGMVLSGSFDITTMATFADGVHIITAKETDAANLTSGPSSGFAVNVSPAEPTLASVFDQPVAGAPIRVRGTGGSGDTLTLFADGGSTPVGSGTVTGDGSFDITTTATFAAGALTLTAKQTDSQNLTSGFSNALTVSVPSVSSTPDVFDLSFHVAGVFGEPELVWQRQSDGLAEIQFVSGDQSFGGGIIPNSPFNSASWTVVGVADFNNDGNADLVYRNTSTAVAEIQFLNGTMAIGGGALNANPFGLDWNVVGIGDVNGDGHQDLVFQRPSDGLVEVMLLNGTTVLGGGVISGGVANAPLWQVTAVTDINGDGKSDLVYRNTATGAIQFQLLDGATSIGVTPLTTNPFGTDWNVIGAGDVLGNGHNDMVFQRPADGLVEIMLLNGTTEAGGGVIANSPFSDPSWQVVGVGDFNHDGKADLLYRNIATGTTEVQFLNGTTPIGGGIIAVG
jgi:hypothetical protein